jgi:transposase
MPAELGADMTVFGSHRRCARWAPISPANNESGGKRRSASTGRGNPWLREILTECARAASRSHATYPKAQSLRPRRSRGDNKAIIAAAHSIPVSAYHVLTRNEPYKDPGLDYLDRLEHDERRYQTTRSPRPTNHR